jgi:hypothetical protein
MRKQKDEEKKHLVSKDMAIDSAKKQQKMKPG